MTKFSHYSPFTLLPTEPIDEIGKYPYLVVRLKHGWYQRHQISIYYGEPSVTISHDKNFVQYPELIPDGGVIPHGCRTLILNAVFNVIVKTKFRFRMAVVWGEKEVSYVEQDGSIDESTVRPSGGAQAPCKLAYDISLPNIRPVPSPSKIVRQALPEEENVNKKTLEDDE